MPWLNLKTFLPPKKVWKVFTNKLHTLSRSKAIKKPKNQSQKKKLSWPSLSIQPKKFKKTPNPHTLIHHQRSLYGFQKWPPSCVFVDQLFIEPADSVVKENKVDPLVAAAAEGANYEEKLCSSSSLNKSSQPEFSDDDMISADDIWESMVLASPAQMHGINERAEAFIARFRAEMQHQEMLARRL